MVSYHQHTEERKVKEIANLLEEGEKFGTSYRRGHARNQRPGRNIAFTLCHPLTK